MNFLKFVKKLMVVTMSTSLNIQVNNCGRVEAETGSDFYINSSFNVLRQLDTCAAFYFSNLSTNYAYNHFGSCGFVALGSLLSYYDTYLNDNFVDDKYEENVELTDLQLADYFLDNQLIFESPGVKFDKEETLALNSESYGYYPSFLWNKMSIEDRIDFFANNGYFQYYLLQLAYQQNYEKLKPASKLDFAMMDTDLRDLLNVYLQSKKDDFSSAMIDIGNSVSSYINKRNKNFKISTIIDLIKSGVPVLALVNNTKNDDKYYGHFAIAYDYREGYDLPEDGIIFNIGLSDESDCNVTSIPFYYMKKYTAATQIYSYFHINEENFVHEETDNYYYYLDKSITSCLCELSVHKNHEHEYGYRIIDDKTHQYGCVKCLSRIISEENHRYVLGTLYDPLPEYVTCLLCSYVHYL